MLTIYTADDHPVLSKGLRDIINVEHGFQILGYAADGETALREILQKEPDVAVLDIEMPLLNGIEVVKKLKENQSKTKVIFFTLYNERSFFLSAMDLGIRGYLLKDSPPEEIISCIKTVSDGGAYVSPSLSAFLVDRHSQKSILSALSKQEQTIVKLIGEHKTSAQIADLLFISEKTVSNHRSNISRKLKLDKKQNSLLTWVLENKHKFLN